MRIDKKNLLVFVLWCLTSVVGGIIISLVNGSYNYDEWSTIVASITLLHFVLGLCLMINIKCKLYSLSVIFYLCAGVFHYGQLWLSGLVKTYEFHAYNMLTLYPQNYYEATCLYIYLVLALYVGGVIFCNGIEKNQGWTGENLLSENSELVDKTKIASGRFILMVTLPVNLIINALMIRASSSGGYLAAIHLNIPDMISTIGWISVLGFVLLIYGYSGRKSNVIAMTAILIYGVEMMSGSRGESMCAILTIAMFWFYKKNVSLRKIGIGRIILIIVLGFVLLSLVATLKEFRGWSQKSFEGFMFCLTRELKNGLILRELEEFGSSIAIPSLTQIYIDETGAYLHGWTYVSGLFTVIPNVFGNISNISASGSLGNLLLAHGVKGAYTAIGESFVAELLLNFKYTWWVVAFLVGILFEKFSKRIEVIIYNKKSMRYVMVVFAMLHWVRWNFGYGVRLIVWGYLLYLIADNIMKNLGRR